MSVTPAIPSKLDKVGVTNVFYRGNQILLCTAVIIFLSSTAHADSDWTQFKLKNASQEPQFEKLPKFYTSDAAYDEFLNEYFMRHLSVDDIGIERPPIMVGVIDNLWTVEWDAWFLSWIDRGAMGLQRQMTNPSDIDLSTILKAVVDKYGYTWFGDARPEPNDSIGGYYPSFGWCWPKYNSNYTVTKPTGWEFNGADNWREESQSSDIDFEPQYANACLVGKITGPRPEIITPKFDTDVFQVPIVEIDIEYKTPTGEGSDRLINQFKLYWATNEHPRFSEERMVTADFLALPPKDFPGYYTPWVNKAAARYSLYFPMYLHPEWGRSGRRITRLKIVPAGDKAEGVTVSLNYIRASYDIRGSVPNTILINSAYRFFMWSGDREFLKAVMPRLRSSILFLNNHLQGKKDRLLNFSWMVGHDGLGGKESGHGMIGCYWDLLPCGHYDIESSVDYYLALHAMAEMERVAAKRGIRIPDVNVVGPDNKTIIRYKETPASLEALARKVKTKIEKTFWVPETGRFCRNIDINGKKHDYGFLHFNLFALTCGIGTDEQRKSILSWLDGRVIPGDTSTGADIYKWRFAPRTSTKHNKTYYMWPWVVVKPDPADPVWGYSREWGNQVQDGGAVPFTSLFELVSRINTGEQKQVDKTFERTLEIKKWYEDVKAAGGRGTEFYRAYYNGHPERGIQQGGGPPGGLGLDREFLSDSALGTTFPIFAFLGVKAEEDNIISVTPAIPSKLDKVGVTNVFYRGNHLTIEAGHNYVSLEGSKTTNATGLKLRVIFRNAPKGSRVFMEGKPLKNVRRTGRDLVALTDLQPVRMEIRP